MATPSVGIAISTAYGSDRIAQVRFSLAQELVKTAKEHDLQVYFADNSPTDEVIEVLRDLGAIGDRISNTALPCLGRAEAIQRSLQAGHDHTLLTEAEKVDLLSYAQEMLEFSEQQNIDVLFPERSAEGMASHPRNMQETEPIGNQRIKEITGYDYDWYMGAHLLSEQAAAEYIKLQSDPGASWPGGQMAAAVHCLCRGMRGGSYPVPEYRYPREQREIEDGNPVMAEKRAMLLETIVRVVKEQWEREQSELEREAIIKNDAFTKDTSTQAPEFSSRRSLR